MSDYTIFNQFSDGSYDLIIAGGRDLNEKKVCNEIVKIKHLMPNPRKVISGTATGSDIAGEMFANLYDIEIDRNPAEWSKYGRRAGHLRNEVMALKAQALLLIWDGMSPGSANMKMNATRMNLAFHEIIVGEGFK